LCDIYQVLNVVVSSIGLFIVSEMTENPTAKYEKFWFRATLLIDITWLCCIKLVCNFFRFSVVSVFKLKLMDEKKFCIIIYNFWKNGMKIKSRVLFYIWTVKVMECEGGVWSWWEVKGMKGIGGVGQTALHGWKSSVCLVLA